MSLQHKGYQKQKIIELNKNVLDSNISGENNGIERQIKNEYLKKMIHKYTTVVLSIALLNSDSLSFK